MRWMLIAAMALAACDEAPAPGPSMQRSLGLRAPDDAPRTTAGAGTSGQDTPDAASVAPDPTTGSTNGAPERVEPRQSGTTGGGPLPIRDDSAPLPA